MAVPPAQLTAYTADDDLAALRLALLLIPPRPLPTGTINASKSLLNMACILTGFSFREAAGTPALAQLELFDGADNTGGLVSAIAIAASGSVQVGQGIEGVICQQGLFLSMIAGTVRGSVWARYGGKEY